MHTPFVAGNWKMNTSVQEAVALVKELRPMLDGMDGVEKVLCPPFISLASVKALLEGSSIKLGAQNMYFEEKGAFTGEISPLMLAGLCQFVILGHSERRGYFGETDELINKKVKAAIKVGLRPILCVGERLDERRAGRAKEVVVGQLSKSLEGIGDLEGIVIAYEPVWAIGTGLAASGEQAQEMMMVIRGALSRLTGNGNGAIPLLYGGSVTAANVGEFVKQPDVQGALVGGASLKAGEFADIVKTTSRIKGKR